MNLYNSMVKILVTIFWIGFDALIIWAIVRFVQIKKAKDRALGTCATSLGLQFSKGTWLRETKAEGEYRSHHIILDTYGVGGKIRTRYSRVRLTLPRPVERQITLQPNPKNKDAHTRTQALQSMMDSVALRNDARIIIENQEIRFEQTPWVTDPIYLQTVIDLVIRMAETLEKSGGA